MQTTEGRIASALAQEIDRVVLLDGPTSADVIAAYPEQTITVSQAAGVLTTDQDAVFPMSPGETIRFYGYRNNASGEIRNIVPNGSTKLFEFQTSAAGGTTIRVAGHTFAVGNTVVMRSSNNTVPAPFVAGTTYFVESIADDVLTLEATVGGGAITVTADGGGIMQDIIEDPITNEPDFTILAGATIPA